MTMNKNVVSCGFEGDLTAFAGNALPAQPRRKFLAHLVECQRCVDLLEAIAVDEKLAERHLDTEEKALVSAIVQSARGGIAAGLELERPHRNAGQHEIPPTLAWQAKGGLRRSVFVAFSTAAASALCLWLYSRLA